MRSGVALDPMPARSSVQEGPATVAAATTKLEVTNMPSN
jgi:hypothetical protein